MPSVSLNDYMKHRAVIRDVEPPRLPEFGPIVDAASKAYSPKKVGDETFAPGLGFVSGRTLRGGQVPHWGGVTLSWEDALADPRASAPPD